MGRRPEVLVIGGTGIIGQEIVRACALRGFDVTSVSRRPPTADARDHAIGGRITHLSADLSASRDLAALLDGRRFDAAVDLLSFTPGQLGARVNQLRPFVTQYLFVSSATVFDAPDVGGTLSEDSRRIELGWSYATQKIKCELRFRELLAPSDTAYTIVRPYITYSPKRLPFGYWESDVMLPRLRAGATLPFPRELDGVRTSLSDARDVGRAIACLVGNDAARDNDVNIASDHAIRWNEVFDVLMEASHSESKLVPVDIAQVLQDFPEMNGKTQDRRMTRAFDATKLQAIVPGFEFRHRFSVEDAELMFGKMRASQRLLTVQGRLDRLIMGAGGASSVVSMRPGGLNMDSLRYHVGRHRALWWLGNAIRSRATGGRARDYGVA